MYIIVKNGDSVIPRGLNKYGWKYLDECQEAAIAMLKSTSDVVEIYELAEPHCTFTLNVEKVCGPGEEPTEEPSEPVEEEPKEDETPAEDEEPAENSEPEGEQNEENSVGNSEPKGEQNEENSNENAENELESE